MSKEINKQTATIFEQIRRVDENGNEYWFARDMFKVLEYNEYRNFKPVVEKAKKTCKNSGHSVEDHFVGFHEMVDIDSGAKRKTESVKLSRYACYLIVQNADPNKEVVALGQTYFAVQTRLQEIMSNNLSLSCIQTELVWENIDQNLKQFSEKLDQVPNDTELIILPEMFTTGFTMNAVEMAETMDGKSFRWMKEQSKKYNKIIIGSIIIKEDKNYYNRCITMFPNGEYYTYDKGHLFRMEKEHEDFTKGENKTIFKHNGWRVCTLICYDLRFPVWSRNQDDYDLLIYIASWPESRRDVWNTLLKARAIENQSYVIGVNRIGNDGEGITYSGDTVVINAKGQIIAKANDYKDEIINAELSLDELNQFRKKFPVILDADDFKIL